MADPRDPNRPTEVKHPPAGSEPAGPDASAPPSGSARSAVEAPGRRGTSALWLVVGAVIAALVVFLLVSFVAEEAEEATLRAPSAEARL